MAAPANGAYIKPKDFQKSVGFLMGFDLIRANVVTYDIQYNSLILYSNLLIRQIKDTFLLVTTQPQIVNGVH